LSNLKHIISFIFAVVILVSLVLPVFAIQYAPGVSTGQYVKYGNFAGSVLVMKPSMIMVF